MGTYYTCKICGKESKNSYDCECNTILTKSLLKNMIGLQIINTSINEYNDIVTLTLINDKNEVIKYSIKSFNEELLIENPGESEDSVEEEYPVEDSVENSL